MDETPDNQENPPIQTNTIETRITTPTRRRNPPRIRLIAPANRNAQIPPWSERVKEVPRPGRIRLLDPPGPHCFDAFLWIKDMTLTEWTYKINQSHRDISENPIAVAFRVPDYIEKITELFESNQRKRWLARLVFQRWTQRVWRKRTQCNIDMIDMLPIKDADAIFLTDTTHHTVFRFHRNDVFKSILSNLCLSDEMLPTPRYPTNPWTNSQLTMAQTMGICQQLAADYGRRCRSPPVLFAAFWASRFNLKRFLEEHSSLLAQHAIVSFFKDLHEHNMLTVFDTITNLLSRAGLDYSPFAIRKWVRQSPQTPLHKEWLALIRDYTLYINLHVQIRANWYTEEYIYHDVRRLYSRTVLPGGTSQRMRLLRAPLDPISSLEIVTQPMSMFGLNTLPSMLQLSQDVSGSFTETLVSELLRTAFYR